MSENLPSVNELVENISSNYPKLEENNKEELPSLQDFIEEEEIYSDDLLIEKVELPENVEKEENIQGIINLIENVRKEIPEIKTYDKELYDVMVLIEEVRKTIPEPLEIPEVKYYDEDISLLQSNIEEVRNQIPEVKYYDEDVESLQNKLEEVIEARNSDVEVLSNKIQEVSDRDIPNFGWIGNTFNTIDEDFGNVKDRIETIKHQFDEEVRKVYESISVSEFETKTDSNKIKEDLSEVNETILEKLDTTKDGIYNQLKETSLRIWTLNTEFKDDHKSLGKKINEEYAKLKDNIDEQIKQYNDENVKSHSSIREYFEELRDEVSNLPEVKYYDEEIDVVNENVRTLQLLVEELSRKQSKFDKKVKDINEGLLNIPSGENNSDPLTPLDQNFATLEDLSSHYRLFLNRIQQQLATIGGGGAVRIEDLDDVDITTAKVDGKFLKYQASTDKWVGATGGGGGSYSGTTGQFLQHDGSDFVGIASTALRDYIQNDVQGFYGYTTDAYNTGTANTIQTLPADTWTIIDPQVNNNDLRPYLPLPMNTANNGQPFIIGAGATIGTGQTEFSLAGAEEGSSMLVRVGCEFDPDVDITNLDIRLRFTNNATTIAAGSTNWSLTQESALIMDEGADQGYKAETLFSFFVGPTMVGLTTQTAGSFHIEANPSEEGDFEMKAFTVNVSM